MYVQFLDSLPSSSKGTSTAVPSSGTSKVDHVAPTQLRPLFPTVTVESTVVQAVGTLSGKTVSEVGTQASQSSRHHRIRRKRHFPDQKGILCQRVKRKNGMNFETY